jgi:hypothetical protein
MSLLPMVLNIVVSTQMLILLQPSCKLMLINLLLSPYFRQMRRWAAIKMGLVAGSALRVDLG